MKHLPFNHIRRLAALLLVALLMPAGAWAEVSYPNILVNDQKTYTRYEYYVDNVNSMPRVTATCETEGATVYYSTKYNPSTTSITDDWIPVGDGFDLPFKPLTTYYFIAEKDGELSTRGGYAWAVLPRPVKIYIGEEELVSSDKSFLPGELSLICPTEGLELYYELSNEGPVWVTESSPKYENPVFLSYSTSRYYLSYRLRYNGAWTDDIRQVERQFYIQAAQPTLTFDGVPTGSNTHYYNPVTIAITHPDPDVEIYYEFSDNDWDGFSTKETGTLYTGPFTFFDFWADNTSKVMYSSTIRKLLKVSVYKGDQIIASLPSAYPFEYRLGEERTPSWNFSIPSGSVSREPVDLTFDFNGENNGVKLYYEAVPLDQQVETIGTVGSFLNARDNGRLTEYHPGDAIHLEVSTNVYVYAYDERTNACSSTGLQCRVEAETPELLIDGAKPSNEYNLSLTKPVQLSFRMPSGSTEADNTFKYVIEDVLEAPTIDHTPKNNGTVWDGQPITIDHPCKVWYYSYNGRVYSTEKYFNFQLQDRSFDVDLKLTKQDGTDLGATTDLAEYAADLPLYAELKLTSNAGLYASDIIDDDDLGGSSASGDIYYTMTTDGTEPDLPTIDKATKYVPGTKLTVDNGVWIRFAAYNGKLYTQFHERKYTAKCKALLWTFSGSGDQYHAWASAGGLWETGYYRFSQFTQGSKIYYNIYFAADSEENALIYAEKKQSREELIKYLPDPSPENGTLYDASAGIFVDGAFVIKAIAYKDGLEPSEPFTDHNYVYLYEGDISPEPGRYDEPQKIKLTGGWEGHGGQHYYITIDGSDPTTSDTRIMLNSGRIDEKDVPDFYLDHSATVKWTHATAHYHTGVKSATYYIKAGADLSFAQESYEAVVGEAFDSPVLSNPNSLDVTWASANTKVATVDQQGRVTLTGEGQTIISASFAGNNDYLAGEASYILYVREQGVVLEIVLFDDNKTVSVGEKDEQKDLFGDGQAVYTKKDHTLRLNDYDHGGLLRSIGNLTVRLNGVSALQGIDFGYGQTYHGSLARAEAPRRAEGQGNGLLTIVGDGIENSNLTVMGTNEQNMHGSGISLYLSDLIVKDCYLLVTDCSTAIYTKGTDYLKFDNTHAILEGWRACHRKRARPHRAGGREDSGARGRLL